jgi:hypothetical protein
MTSFAAPRWKKGYATDLAFIFMVWALFTLGQYLEKRDEKVSHVEITKVD